MQKENIWKYIKRSIAQSGMVGKLIAVNTVVFLVFLMIQLMDNLFLESPIYEKTLRYLIAPGDLSELIYKPWSIITNMFAHGGFRHFFFNMIVLYFSARIFTKFFGERRLVATYFLGGIFAYFVHIIAYSFLPNFAEISAPSVVGASASIMAIFVGVAIHAPNYKVNFFGVLPVSLILLAALYIISDLIGLGNKGDQIAHFAHLGGALFGGLSVINANSPKNIMNRFDRIARKFSFKRLKFEKKPKMKVYNSTKETKKMTDDEYNVNKVARQERVDIILEKISKKGYEGLTKEEKDILFNESKRK